MVIAAFVQEDAGTRPCVAFVLGPPTREHPALGLLLPLCPLRVSLSDQVGECAVHGPTGVFADYRCSPQQGFVLGELLQAPSNYSQSSAPLQVLGAGFELLDGSKPTLNNQGAAEDRAASAPPTRRHFAQFGKRRS